MKNKKKLLRRGYHALGQGALGAKPLRRGIQVIDTATIKALGADKGGSVRKNKPAVRVKLPGPWNTRSKTFNRTFSWFNAKRIEETIEAELRAALDLTHDATPFDIIEKVLALRGFSDAQKFTFYTRKMMPHEINKFLGAPKGPYASFKVGK